MKVEGKFVKISTMLQTNKHCRVPLSEHLLPQS